jgi:hypothetical protein
MSTLAWEHDGQRKILLICKTESAISATLDLGIAPGSSVTVQRIEGSGRVGAIQASTVAYTESFTIALYGNTVLLLSF